MKVREIGEFGLIEKLAGMLDSAQKATRTELLIGIGDDAAAWQEAAAVQLATIDSLVEGVHFNLDKTSWQDLGWKAAAIGLSDIAAMGGRAGYLLVSLALPDDTEVNDVTRLYDGMLELAGRHRAVIAGGNISQAPQVTITVAAYGSAATDKILRRNGAMAGDKIAVSGHPGTAAAGLEMLTDRITFNAGARAELAGAFLRPQPRLALGRLLVKHGANAAIDLSDGLLADLGHLCRASGTAARLEVGRLPVHPAVRAGFSSRATELALSGGEDYELLFTSPGQAVERIAAAAGLPVTVIGEITTGQAGEINLVAEDGSTYAPHRAGWEHFVSR